VTFDGWTALGDSRTFRFQCRASSWVLCRFVRIVLHDNGGCRLRETIEGVGKTLNGRIALPPRNFSRGRHFISLTSPPQEESNRRTTMRVSKGRRWFSKGWFATAGLEGFGSSKWSHCGALEQTARYEQVVGNSQV
jgi:hypothetical protein